MWLNIYRNLLHFYWSLVVSTERMIVFTALLSTERPGWRSRYSDLLLAGRSGDRNPVEASFSAPVQTEYEAHLAYYKMKKEFLSRKWPGRGVNDPPLSTAKVRERVELPLLHLWTFMAGFRAKFTFTCHQAQRALSDWRCTSGLCGQEKYSLCKP
jgi:hypothetical protein